MPRLSVALITFNEERNLAACLRSVSFADEIVVIDNASTDRTREIAREFGARVLEVQDWPGFGPQKNRAVDACTGDWILALDADERVEEPLRAEIEQALARADFDVYAMPRRSTYCGRYIRHGGWWPDYVTRLFRRGSARYSDARVHERLVTERPVGRLRAPLTHFSFRSMEQVLGKMNQYSSESARMLGERGRTPGLASAIGHGIAAFLRTYVIRLGFLDGRHGFLLAVSNAEGSYYRYVKAMLAAETRRDDVE
ncbi:MAG TPA: glycosyltransferase family 2 protein [Burkholderiaceae bacterium]|nr:glycosyltransferase family 2 protein [Burkholderiaceae bacterium]